MSEAHNDEKTVLAMFGGIGGTYNNTPGSGADFRSAAAVNAPQPMPAGGTGPDIFDLVIADFRERNELGLRTYGATLRAHDGRINDIDLYQELLDAVVYMRKRLEEHKRTPFNSFASDVHAANRHWWVCPKCKGTGRSTLTVSGDCLFCEATGIENREVPKLLMLTVSELAEAMEGDRKDLMDDKLPHRKMFEVEIADVFIRLFDMAGRHNLDLDGAIREKLLYNQTRKDHTAEARAAAGGKKY